MAGDDALMEMEGMEQVLHQLSFLQSININKDYLVPGMKSIGASVRKVEKGKIATFSGKTQRSLSSKTSQNGIGSVTLTIGPSSKRRYIFNILQGGAKWKASGKSGNTSVLPAQRLVEWVKKKLGASDEEALQVAFRVAKTIGRQGIPGKPIVMPTVEEVKSYVVSSINSIIHRMVEEIHKYG